ncbi:MAG: hypothetical protein ACTJFR_02590 [Canibacter sp.]
MGRTAVIFAVILGTWMSLGTLMFNLGSFLNWWYLPIGVTYIGIAFGINHYLKVIRRKEHHRSPAILVFLILSWLTAISFGFTVPGMRDGVYESITSVWFGEFWREMSIALCNPFGILAFVFLLAALGFGMANARDPQPEEDEGMDEIRMVSHPLSRD